MSAQLSLGEGVGRWALIGSVAGLVTVAVGATAGLLAVGLDLAHAAGVGTFAALWGGPGFGALFGAVLAIHRNDRR